MHTFKKIDYFEKGSKSWSIGKDLRLMDRKSYWNESGEPFIADATVAVFLISGTAELQVNMVDYKMKANSRVNIHKRKNRDWKKAQSLWLLTPAAP